jgi:NAD-dependent SIR2 family protein deacetylase
VAGAPGVVAAAMRGGGISTANGITTNRSLGLNYRNEWGKKITAYGSYSFADRDKLQYQYIANSKTFINQVL